MRIWERNEICVVRMRVREVYPSEAGIDKTIIRDETSTAAGDEPFDLKGVEGKPFRITGITFDGTGLPNAGTWAGAIVISGNCKKFRVDHCKFLNMDRMMTISGDTCGLIDHCYFHALQKKGGLAQTIMGGATGAGSAASQRVGYHRLRGSITGILRRN